MNELRSMKGLIVRELSRFPSQGEQDKLVFRPGVNVVVGPPNTGKTKWLRILDYLLGDDGKPEEAFGDDLAQKYHSAHAVLNIAGEELVIERRWKEPGVRTKIFLDDEAFAVRELGHALMERLSTPVIHYPQGSPYGARTWPELSWRSLFRHIYRRQGFWSDLADQQPHSEQHACLMQFLGIAQNLFSEQYGDLISKQKEIVELQAAKDQFINTLNQVSREIVDEASLGVALTPQSLDIAIQRVRGELEAVEERRRSALALLLNAATVTDLSSGAGDKSTVQRLSEDLARLQAEEEKILVSLRNAENRLAEIHDYRSTIEGERSRIERAKRAGVVLADLKVTHCPACDRELTELRDDGEKCYLCRRPMDENGSAVRGSEQRLEFELQRLDGELEETNELITALSQDVHRLTNDRARISDDVRRIRETLRPIWSAAAQIMSPEVSIADMETGRLQERVRQLERIKAALQTRELLSDRINEIQQAVTVLETQVAEHGREIDFERSGELLEDGMNTYLNLIQELNPLSWTQDKIRVRLSERGLKMMVGRSNWQAKVGGTLTLYFLISYHYALMNLTDQPSCHYPGLCLLDLPAKLEDGSLVKDKENFVLEPFIELTGREGMEFSQMIAAGSSFEGLHGAHRIELNRIWK